MNVIRRAVISRRSGGTALVLSVLYVALYLFLDGEMIAAPFALVLGLGVILIWLSVEDMAQQSFPVLGLGLFLGVATAIGFSLATDFQLHIAAAAGFGLAFLGIDYVFRQRRGTPALGSGDAVMIAGTGVLLGPMATVHVILLASLAGLAVVAGRSFFPREQTELAMPFGPFLALGTWCLFLEPALLV